MRFPAMIKPSPRRSTPFIINQTKRGISSRDASFLIGKVQTGTNCAQIVRPLHVRPNALLYFVRYDRRNSGASRGIRTLDTWFRRPVLYPLSYRRLTSVIIAYGEKIRKGKRCLTFARQEDTNQIPLSSSTGSFKTIFLQILSGCASGRT